MKIGLIGINIYTREMNYACPLHIYAFQSFLKDQGIETIVIDYMPNRFKFDKLYDYRKPYIYYENKCNKLIHQIELLSNEEEKNVEKITALKNKIDLCTQRQMNFEAIKSERAKRYDKQKAFIDKYIIKTEYTYNCAIMEIEDPGFDCYICVTDVIWDKFPTGYEPGFFLGLSCMENKWKIAYSASKLVTENYNDQIKTSDWIKDIDFVSVREDFMQKEIQKNVRADVACVLDPVLLQEANFYENILIKPYEKEYILLYYVVEVNPDIVLCAIDYAKKNNVKIIELSDKPFQNELTKNCGVEVVWKYEVGVQEWLGYIRYAKCIFTNSFHGCCLSIIFKKNFYVSRRNNYDKITALLRIFNLTDRITDYTTYSSIVEQIDSWDNVSQILKKRYEESKYFILNAITVASQQEHPQKDYLLLKKRQNFPIRYNMGMKTNSLEDSIVSEYVHRKEEFVMRANSVEFLAENISNDGTSYFNENVFRVGGYKFSGYRIQVCFDMHKFYYLEDGTFQECKSFRKTPKANCKIFMPGDVIPIFDVNRINACVAECIWVKE